MQHHISMEETHPNTGCVFVFFLCNFASHHCKTLPQLCKLVSHHCTEHCSVEKWPRIILKGIYTNAKRPRIIVRPFCSSVSYPRNDAGYGCTIIWEAIMVAVHGQFSFLRSNNYFRRNRIIDRTATNAMPTAIISNMSATSLLLDMELPRRNNNPPATSSANRATTLIFISLTLGFFLHIICLVVCFIIAYNE